MPAGWAVEPVAAIFALGVRQPLFLFTLGTHAVHLAASDVIIKNESAFCADLGIATVIGSLATRGWTDKYRVTGVTPVFATGHIFTNRTFFHWNS